MRGSFVALSYQKSKVSLTHVNIPLDTHTMHAYFEILEDEIRRAVFESKLGLDIPNSRWILYFDIIFYRDLTNIESCRSKDRKRHLTAKDFRNLFLAHVVYIATLYCVCVQ